MDQALTLRLDAATYEALTEEARRTKRSKGRIVRDALAAHFRSTKARPEPTLAKYAGCVDGPRDLSHNKAYLEGMGKPGRK